MTVHSCQYQSCGDTPHYHVNGVYLCQRHASLIICGRMDTAICVRCDGAFQTINPNRYNVCLSCCDKGNIAYYTDYATRDIMRLVRQVVEAPAHHVWKRCPNWCAEEDCERIALTDSPFCWDCRHEKLAAVSPREMGGAIIGPSRMAGKSADTSRSSYWELGK